MESIEIIKNILPGESAYKKTLYLLYNYRDMENGKKIDERQRGTLDIIDKAIELISDDPYIEIIRMLVKGKKVTEIAEKMNMDKANVYRNRKRLIKRISIIIYGDAAL